MDKNYGGVVWTDHALKRLKERKIKQGDAWATFRRPDSSRKAQKKGTYVYYKTYNGEKIEVVATQNRKKEWVIMSVWSKRIHDKKTKEDIGFVKRVVNFLINK